MRTWIKYLIIGWSIVSIGIITVSYQIMKKEFIHEDYSITLEGPLATSENLRMRFIDALFLKENESITKKEFVERVKDIEARNIEVKVIDKKVNKSVYLYLPLYSFTIWAIPVVVFSLLGLIFKPNK